MAKDRTRHARRRKPERAGVSLYGMVTQDMGRALVGFAEGTGQALFSFADVAASVAQSFAELRGRLTDEHD